MDHTHNPVSDHICKILVCMFPGVAEFKYLTSACEMRAALSHMSPYCLYHHCTVQLICIVYKEISFWYKYKNGSLILLREKKYMHIKDMKWHVSFYLSPHCCSCHSCVHSPQGDHKEELCERMQLPKSD